MNKIIPLSAAAIIFFLSFASPAHSQTDINKAGPAGKRSSQKKKPAAKNVQMKTTTPKEPTAILVAALSEPEELADIDWDKVRRAIEAGAEVNITEESVGETPLIIAAKTGEADIAQLLIEKGALINASDTFGYTSLMWTATLGHQEAAKVLLENGADLTVKDTSGMTALLCATGKGHAEIVKLLLDHGADVNAKTSNDITSLMWAAYEGRIEIARLLLQKGADINARDNQGYTALSLAKTEEIKQLLRSYGAKE